MGSSRLLSALLLATALLAACEAAPFFDAIYDAINGNPQRTYGYNGYGNYQRGWSSYYPSYKKPANPVQPHRQEKSWKDICRVHYPNSFAVPGTGGIVCPY